MKKIILLSFMMIATIVAFGQRTVEIDDLTNTDTIYSDVIIAPNSIQVLCENVSGTSTGKVSLEASIDNVSFFPIVQKGDIYSFPSDSITISDGAILCYKCSYFPYYRVKAEASSGTQVTSFNIVYSKN